MPLEAGRRIGPYEVAALIGEGGMGQVYRARDTKLDRDVALKVLPDAFTADPDRLARFEREARVLASLNHPNIGSIYGLEEAEGGTFRALVLELVGGPTLADRIAQGPITVDEALPIARQIADALEAAHEQGIIHRDLKPANIKLKPDGTVKVLDFGLAKALDPTPEGDPAQSPTLTAAATRMGVILGTAAYMSPEQARGKPVDKRADIWAFGCVVYEMLTSQRAFQGEDVSLTLASVMKSDLDVRTLPPDLPAAVRTALRRCLEKDSRERVRDIGDVRLAMQGAFETTVTAPSEPSPDPADDQGPLWSPEGERVVFRSDREPQGLFWKAADGRGAVEPLLGGEAVQQLSFLSPDDWSFDGTALVFSYTAPETNDDIGILSMDGERAWQPLLSSAANEDTPALSPDGAWIAYASNETGQLEVYVERFPDLGDKEQISTGGGRGPVWSHDGSELFYRDLSGARMMVVAIGTEPTLTLGAPAVAFEGPYYLPPFNRHYDVAPDGRFLMIKPSGAATNDDAAAVPQIVVVENWFEELQRLVPLP